MKSILTVIALIVALVVILMVVMLIGSAGRKLVGDDPDRMEKPRDWGKTILIGIVGLALLGYVSHRSGCNRSTDYQMENSRDPGY